MDITWLHELTEIDWQEVAHLYRLAPLGENPPDHYQEIFANSKYKCFAFEGQKLVGVGRALADGRDCSYLCDIAVHPDYQGLGLGRRIVQKLLDFSRGHKKVILYASPGKEGFYAKLGFKMMNTAMAIFKDQERAFRTGMISEPGPAQGAQGLQRQPGHL